jgi:hypothetical protein
VVEDYAESSASTRAFYDDRNHQQAGDPAKLGTALVTLASEERPPIRYAAGSDAVGFIADKATALREELERWLELSVSTDLVPEAAWCRAALRRCPITVRDCALC